MSATGIPKKVLHKSSRKKDTALYLDCFQAVTKHTEYWNKWIVDKCWISIINERFDIPSSLQFDERALNAAIGRNPVFKTVGIATVSVSNSLGIYKSSFRPTE